MSRDNAQERLIVVPYEPGRKLRQRLVAWLAVLIGMAGGFTIGAIAFYQHFQTLLKEHQDTQVALRESRQEAETLRHQVASLERGRAIDRKAVQEAQATMVRLEEKIARLQEDVNFYKKILAPSQSAGGLKVQKWEVEPVRGQLYRYKLVLAQMASGKGIVEGVVAINFVGMGEGEPEVLPLRDLTGGDELGIPFRFRYFQEFMGEFTLPADFRPHQVQLVIQLQGKAATNLEHTYPWQQEETESHVGKKQI